jgi:indolepyruvate decarboxylase
MPGWSTRGCSAPSLRDLAAVTPKGGNVAFTVCDYILTRLTEQHVDTLFGVPAAYCAELFDAAARHHVRSVVTASDLEAGYAADGYARCKGLGAVAVAYGVGSLSMLNAIAGAYVERSPVVVVNGGPNGRNLRNLKDFDVVFSHSTGRPDTDLKAYRLVTASASRAGKASEVPTVVDTAIATAVTTKRPTYVEINQDLWNLVCPKPAGPLSVTIPATGTEKQLAARIVGLIRAAKAPVLLVGTEVQRYGLADQVGDLIAKLGIRWSTALLAKSALPEGGNRWLGVYNPPHSGRAVASAVEKADLLLLLGCVFPNGYGPLITSRSAHIVSAYDGKVRVQGGAKEDAALGSLVSALVAEAARVPRQPLPSGDRPDEPRRDAVSLPTSAPLTYRQVFERIAVALDGSWITVPDTFLGVFSAANLPTKGRDAFLCSAVWASIGHSVAAAVGASYASDRRPLVICGDGGFHMTAQALSTMAHYGRNPVVVIIDNGIYAYEQYLIDRAYFGAPDAKPKPYVALNRWDFVAFAKALGVEVAKSVNTATAFDAALAAATSVRGPALIVAKVDPHDVPVELSG